MASPLVQQTGYNGSFATRTAAIYRLDQFLKPVGFVTDVLPGLTTSRVTVDVIEGESYSQSYSVTDNTLQDFSFATSQIRRNSRTIQITGVLSAILPPGNTLPASAFNPATVANKDRADLVRFKNLETLAAACQPIAVFTPRHSFPLCAITDINATWNPDTGINTRISISFKEIRIANPIQGNFIPDYTELSVANAANISIGVQNAEPSPVTPNQIYFTPENFIY